MEYLRYILRPIVHFCIRNSLTYGELNAVCRALFIELAEDEIKKTSQKINVSRISVLTGINRKDVTKIYREKRPPSIQSTGLLSRVIGQWENDRRFTTTGGIPKVLTYRGDDNEFRDLVSAVSSDLNAGTIFFELERKQLITRTPRGIRLIWDSAVQHDDSEKALGIVGKDINSLLFAAEENVKKVHTVKNLHVRTEADNIYLADSDEVRRWLYTQGQAFHKRVRAFLAKHDKDLNARSKGDGRARVRVSIGSYSHIQLPDGPDTK